MADYTFQVRLGGISHLPDDVYENVLCFEVNAPDTVEGRCQDLAELYNDSPLFGGVDSCEVRAYAITGGPPVASYGPITRVANSVPFPHEVALCLSYTAAEDPDLATPRRRGRIFIGPLGNVATISNGRPGNALKDTLLDFGESLAAIGTGGNTTWKLHSRSDNVTAKIEAIYCDDAWDTQRRRGLAPTAREVRDVQ